MKVLAVGKGPGPKNVLLEVGDGRKIVTTYGNYRFMMDTGYIPPEYK